MCDRTFLCLHSSHLGMIFSSVTFLFFWSGSGEVAAGGGSTSKFSSAEGVACEEWQGDIATGLEQQRCEGPTAGRSGLTWLPC